MNKQRLPKVGENWGAKIGWNSNRKKTTATILFVTDKYVFYEYLNSGAKACPGSYEIEEFIKVYSPPLREFWIQRSKITGNLEIRDKDPRKEVFWFSSLDQKYEIIHVIEKGQDSVWT